MKLQKHLRLITPDNVINQLQEEVDRLRKQAFHRYDIAAENQKLKAKLLERSKPARPCPYHPPMEHPKDDIIVILLLVAIFFFGGFLGVIMGYHYQPTVVTTREP